MTDSMQRHTRRPLARAIGAGVFALTVAAGAFAQGNMATPPASGRSASGASASAGVAAADKRFITEAAQGGMAEVALGQLAQQKAASDAVKQFGARMVKDHTAANDALIKIANDKGVEVPQKLEGKHQRMIDRLSKMSGEEFDRTYVREMVSDHKKDVSDFEKASRDAKDPDVKAFATSTLPVLKEHRQMAEQLNGQMNASRGGRASTAAGGGK
jgi:putative membrane protein